eukprot:2449530-Amphidinium_carterae.1
MLPSSGSLARACSLAGPPATWLLQRHQLQTSVGPSTVLRLGRWVKFQALKLMPPTTGPKSVSQNIHPKN